MTKQQRELHRQIAEVKAEAAKIRKLLGPDLCRVVVLRWPVSDPPHRQAAVDALP